MDSNLYDLLELVGEGFWIWERNDQNKGNFYMSPKFKKYFGYTENELKNSVSTYYSLIHPDDLKESRAAFESYLGSSVEDSFYRQIRFLHRNGQVLWSISRAKVVSRDANGKIMKILGSHTDVTLIKNAESSALNRVQKKERFYKTILENLPNMVFLKEAKNLKFTYMNAFGEKLLGQNRENLINKNDYDFFPAEQAQFFQKKDRRVLQSMQMEQIFEEPLETSKGQRWLRTKKVPILNEKGEAKYLLGISEDITEKKEYERQALHQSKLASIGELAAGIGHEINNPLAIVKGLISSIQEQLTDNANSALRQKLEKITSATQRIENIVNGLRSFARSDSNFSENFNALFSFKETYSMVKEIYKNEGISLNYQEDHFDKAPIVKGNQGKIQQVLFNLLANARDATLGQSERKIEIIIENNFNEIRLKVKDNGKGIPDNIKNRIFDPFFTTKRISEGTGIGLSIVHSAIKDLEGSIKFNSIEGKGTEFIVSIPYRTIDIPTKLNKEIIFQCEKSIHQNCHALIAEDEEDIREILRDILLTFGIESTAVSNGKEAYDLFLSNPEKYKLIISDMKMPVMDGLTLLLKIRSHKELKQPRFVIATGGVNINFEDKSSKINKMIDGYFFKPFDIEKIGALLQSLMEQNEKEAA